jgi:predicted Zn-dependent protease
VSRSQDVVERALARAATLGPAITGACALVSQTATVNLRWAGNGLTTNGAATSRTLTAVVLAAVPGGTGVGVVAGPCPDDAAVHALVDAAAAEARDAEPAEDAADLLPGVARPGWDDGPGTTDATRLAGVAEGLGEVFGRARAADRSSYGFALHEVTTTWLGTSTGLRLRHEQPRGTIELTGRAAPDRSAWTGAATRDFAEIDVLALDTDLAARLEHQRRRVDLPPGRYDTVLPPSAVADLMIDYFWSSDARSAHEGRSAFSRPAAGPGATRLGERLTELPLTLSSDPALPGLATADRVITSSSSDLASVFDNGMPIRAVDWLQGGTIAALPTSRFTAALTGLPVTAPAGNLRLASAAPLASTAAVIGGVRRGLLLTCLWYIRMVDPATLLLTGLTRDGVYLVEDGEIVGAAPNFRFNESPLDVLRRAVAAGPEEITLGRESGEYFTRTSAPALLVSGFNMSTVSQAN